MTSNENEQEPVSGRFGRKATIAICAGIFLVAALIVTVIKLTEPKAKREGATKETAMLVDLMQVEYGTFLPEIVAMGTVVPERDVMLRPRAAGEIIKRSEGFTPGGFIKKGEVMLQIDPADYENALRRHESDLRRATADLEMEMGRHDVAQMDYELLAANLSVQNEALVLRQPQLDTAMANVEAAQAAVDQAERDLQRTTIVAPFDAYVLSRHVDVGSQVDPGTTLGRLVGTDVYWVEATVPLSKLGQLDFPTEPGTEVSKVQVHNRSWPKGMTRTGRLFKLVGALDDRTRMARVLVAVDDPLAHGPESAGQQPLMIGSFVETQIRGRSLPDVVRIERDYVRKNDTVWMMADGKLDIREVEIVFSDAQYAYIRDGLDGNEQIVITHLSTVVNGAGLRIAADGAGSE